MPTPAAQPDPRLSRLSLIVAVAAVAAVILAGYLHTLGFPFHFDDLLWLRDNPALRAPLDAEAVWRFRPGRSVPMLTFAAQVAWFGASLQGLRAANLLIHGLAALLAGWIVAEVVRRTAVRKGAGGASPESIGLIAALLFAAHPLGTQAVTYLVQRIASVCALFELGAVAAFLLARRGAGERWWWVSWSCGLLAALSKEMSVALPVLLLVVEWILRAGKPSGRAPLLRLAPFLLIAWIVPVLAATPFGPEAYAAHGLRETPFIGRLEYFLTQLTVVPRYLGLMLWPANQQLDPFVPLQRGFSPPVVAGALLLAALAALALACRRRAPVVALGLGWFLVSVAPESSLIPIRNLMVEHRAYLPLAGIVWIAAAGFAALASRGRGWLVAPLAVVIALTTVTHVRNRVWASDLALWSDNARKSPGSPTAQVNFGLALQEAGRLDEAEAAFRAALRTDPDMVLALSNLGMLYGSQRRLGEARAALERAERLDPRQPDALNNLGMLDWIQGDTAGAARRFERAIAADPASPWARNNLARMRGGGRAP